MARMAHKIPVVRWVKTPSKSKKMQPIVGNALMPPLEWIISIRAFKKWLWHTYYRITIGERANEIVKHAGTILFFIFILLAPMIKLCNKRQCGVLELLQHDKATEPPACPVQRWTLFQLGSWRPRLAYRHIKLNLSLTQKCAMLLKRFFVFLSFEHFAKSKTAKKKRYFFLLRVSDLWLST